MIAIITILFLTMLVPALAMTDGDDVPLTFDPDNPQFNETPPEVEVEDAGTPTPSELESSPPRSGFDLLTGRAKPLVRYDTIYHFQNFDQLFDNPTTNIDYQTRHNDYIGDLIRRTTLRL